jgi:hypothetical protein
MPAAAQPPPALDRSIGLLDATAMVAGIIIGASIFVQPSEMAGDVPSLAGLLTAWLTAGLLTLGGALICAELASAFPRTGGVYVFLSDTLSPALGFLWAWAMFWSMHSGIIAALAVIVARYAGQYAPLTSFEVQVVAVGTIVLLSGVNYAGVRYGSRLQTTFTIGKLAAIVAIVAMAFALGSRLPVHFVPSAEPHALTMSGLFSAIVAALFAFGGWHMVTYAAGETVAASRTIPRALATGTAIVTICYLALNLAYLYVLPLDHVRTSSPWQPILPVRSLGRPVPRPWPAWSCFPPLVRWPGSCWPVPACIFRWPPAIPGSRGLVPCTRGSARRIGPFCCRWSGRRCWWRRARTVCSLRASCTRSGSFLPCWRWDSCARGGARIMPRFTVCRRIPPYQSYLLSFRQASSPINFFRIRSRRSSA